MIKQMRRPQVGLHVHKSINDKTTTTPQHVQELVNKLLMTNSNRECKQETLKLILANMVSPSECLQLFLSTAWRDRNRTPILAEIFLQLTQETDIDFASLIDSCHNNLLKVLTVIGQPNSTDLSLVTLMANIYRMEDLDDDHRSGVEAYLVEIAKAFWPYFIPEKSRKVWNDEICDAICDVLMATGKILEEKCPINMERAFNNITIMMFSSSWISDYTLLRFMELKEMRASNWSFASSARMYYTMAYSKHGRSSCSSSTSSSPISQSSLEFDEDSDHDDEVFSSTSTVSSTVTDKHGVSDQTSYIIDYPDHTNNSSNATLTPSQSENDLISQNVNTSDDANEYSCTTSNSGSRTNSESIPADSNSQVDIDNADCISSSSSTETSTTSEKETTTEYSSLSIISISSSSSEESTEKEDKLKVDNNNSSSMTTLSGDKETVVNDPNYKVTIKKDAFSNQTDGPLVVRVKELNSNTNEGACLDGSDDDSLGWAESYYSEDNNNNIQSNNDNCQSSASSNYQQSRDTNSSRGSFDQNKFGENNSYRGGFQRRYSENDGNNVNGFTAQSRPSGFPGNNVSDSVKPRHGFERDFSENSTNKCGFGGFTRPNGFPGKDSYDRPAHGFQRALSENKGNSENGFGGFTRPNGFPGKESNGNYHNPRPGFHRALSEGDNNSENGLPGNDLPGIDQSKPRQGFQREFSQNNRNNDRRYWKSNLEFPVEESNQDYDQKSRLYLLSFALKPASLERPSDLTLTAELEEEKPWLRDVILAEPMTVLERYG